MYLQPGMMINNEFKPSPYVIRVEDMASIPIDDGNFDYIAYLDWVVEGNVAEQIDLLVEQYPDQNIDVVVSGQIGDPNG